MREMIERFSGVFAPAGREGALCAQIVKRCKELGASVKLDAMGNVVAHKEGKGKKIALLTHMDEPALMVTGVTPDGYLRVDAIGLYPPKQRLGKRFWWTGCTPAYFPRGGWKNGGRKNFLRLPRFGA